jgi:LacI family transcriptional regulator
MAMNLEDIAKQAGVSRSTVSRVINNEPYVSAKTRAKVMLVIEREGFRPNPAARMLVKQRTQIIGAVIPQTPHVMFDDQSYYFPTLLNGVAQAAQDSDYGMLLWLGQSGADQEKFYQRIIHNRLMDGLFIASASASQLLVSHLVEAEIHFVTVERPLYHDDVVSYVTVDNFRAAVMAVDHLIRLGRRHIATITGALDNPDGYDRLEGYKAALRGAGLRVKNSLIAEGKFTRVAGYEGMKKLLPHKPDAVFAASDMVATGALQALHEAGLHVPDDVAVVGFDDLPTALATTPQLTTVRQPTYDKGVRATQLLLDLVEGRVEGPQHVLLETELVIRGTCGARVSASQDSRLRSMV